jgi:Txe/YoeB family toxin of Txe-Axe toxin-antitoxin module
MDGAAPRVLWTPLSPLKSRFLANVEALTPRLPDMARCLRNLTPKQAYHIVPISGSIQLGVGNGLGVTPLPHTLPPLSARELIAKLYPLESCTQPVMVAGEDMGWLWNGLYQLPCRATAPGHRPPLFFLMKDVERLWVILHVHDWRVLLADERVRLFVGEDCFDRFRQSLAAGGGCPWPRLSVRVDPSLWSGSPTLEEILTQAKTTIDQELFRCAQQFRLAHAGGPDSTVARFRGGQGLKILGITSRFTTFLQYSMRDWLASFQRLGHQTRLLIENHDHELCSAQTIARACAEFQPDLVVIIDHYRAEFGGVPEQIPMVMWVQDALPNIFRRQAGAAQGPLDYCLGFARLRMTREFGYPADRYMPTIVGCDELRFQRRELSPAEQAEFGCDVSFVSHASATAESLLKAEIDRAGSPEATRLLRAIFDPLRAVYDAGGIVTEPIQIRRMIDLALRQTKTSIPDGEMPKLMELFTQRINNALFRHQSLHWLAEMGVNLRLYGRGWENHPKLSRFARGVADNADQLALIYAASRISLQISPHGGAHQRVMEGLACGGFFLIRRCPGDLIERRFQALWNWCVSENITTDAELRNAAEPQITAAIAQVVQELQQDPFAEDQPFIETLRASAEDGYLRSAGTVWGEDYDAVAYGSADELRAKVARFLGDESQRRRVADSMREVVLARFTYLATSRRLLHFIADDLAEHRQKVAA